MIPKFRAYDGSLNRMYQSEEVMVCDGNTWIVDEDSVAGEWIMNNDINRMQSTGLKDKNDKEIFESDILYGNDGEDFWNIVEYDKENAKWVRSDVYCNSVLDLSDGIETLKVVGNIYENPEILR